jgi:hypothetical protein
MQLLSGWKEIADHLHLNIRTAQRWEKLGLPVRRPYDSACSPVIADSEEIDQWATRKQTGAAKHILGTSRALSDQLTQLQSAYSRSLRQTRRLLSQIATAQSAQRQLVKNLRAHCQHSIHTGTNGSSLGKPKLPDA